jgi:hypothetical protein
MLRSTNAISVNQDLGVSGRQFDNLFLAIRQAGAVSQGSGLALLGRSCDFKVKAGFALNIKRI